VSPLPRRFGASPLGGAFFFGSSVFGSSVFGCSVFVPSVREARPCGEKYKNVSTHFIVTKKGVIWQLVNPEFGAKHATVHNMRSIGIDLEGDACDPGNSPDVMIDALVKLIRWLCWKYEIPRVQPEPNPILTYAVEKKKRGWEYKCQNPGGPAVDSPGIVGHYQVSPNARHDPGPFFPWTDFLARINVPMTPEPIGPGLSEGEGIVTFPVIPT
jgi:hypothetical protein